MSDLSQNDWANALVEHPEAVILDVRTEDEFESGHIPNALNIDLRMGPGFIDEVNVLDKKKILLCVLSFGCKKRTGSSVDA